MYFTGQDHVVVYRPRSCCTLQARIVWYFTGQDHAVVDGGQVSADTSTMAMSRPKRARTNSTAHPSSMTSVCLLSGTCWSQENDRADRLAGKDSSAALDMLSSREMTELTDWLAGKGSCGSTALDMLESEK